MAAFTSVYSSDAIIGNRTIEPTTVEETVTNDSINLETLANELKKTNERIEGLSNGTR